MNKKILALLIGGFSVFSMSNAMATSSPQTAPMTITGKVLASSCDIDTGSSFGNIALSPVTQKSFAAVGDTAGKQAFTVHLSNCPSSVKKTTVQITGTADSASPSNLAIDKGEGSASGIAIGFTANNTHLGLNTGVSESSVVTNGSVSIPMAAEYVSTSKTIVAGNITATAQMNINYL